MLIPRNSSRDSGRITPIPALASGPISDVHSCYATVRFDGRGFETLQLGLARQGRFPGRVASAGVARGSRSTRSSSWTTTPTPPSLPTPPPTLAGGGSRSRSGPATAAFAEVRSGLKPGIPVIAHTGPLPAPESDCYGAGDGCCAREVSLAARNCCVCVPPGIVNPGGIRSCNPRFHPANAALAAGDAEGLG